MTKLIDGKCPNCNFFDTTRRATGDCPRCDVCAGCGKQIYFRDTQHAQQGYPLVYSAVVYHNPMNFCLSCFQKSESCIPAQHECQPESELVGGLRVSTDVAHYQLIPRIAMERLARRYMHGEKTKGKDAWNALSKNQEVLKSKEALARRLGHIVHHCYQLLDKLANDQPLYNAATNNDDAAAIAWGGTFAICATDAITKEQDASSTPSILNESTSSTATSTQQGSASGEE